jgi:CubicO group peptidase (beta-lactamase class C family)
MSVSPSPEPALESTARIAATAPAVAELAATFAQREHLPGLAYGVVAAGRLVYAGAVGHADLATALPADAGTLFRIASMTKSFTAAAILQLRDAGQLALDDPAARYIPELAALAYPTTDSPALTVRHLLTMAAGWPEDNPWGDRQLVLDDPAFAHLLAAGVPFANAPDVHYEYSNLGYMILGRIVAQVTRMPFQAYVDTHLLQPLGMTASCWNVEAANGRTVAQGYRRVDGAWVEDAFAFAPSAGDAAAFGGLYTSVHDLAKWVAFWLEAWPARDDAESPVLRRSTRREMQRCANLRLPLSGGHQVGAPLRYEAGGYAYGLFAWLSSDLGRIVGHAGGLPGFGSHMLWLPDHDIGVVALANLPYAPSVPVAVQILRHVVAHAHLTPRPVRPAAALVDAQARVSRLFLHWDDALADDLFAANFFLDEPRARWQARLAELRTRHGALHPDGPSEVTNPLRGSWTLRGERGWCRATITLAPTLPPRVQHLGVESIFPPDFTMQAALTALLALTGAPSQRGVARIVDPQRDRRGVLAHLRAVNVLYGACTLEQITGGDGVHATTARVQSAKGPLTVKITLNPRTGKLTTVEFCAL